MVSFGLPFMLYKVCKSGRNLSKGPVRVEVQTEGRALLLLHLFVTHAEAWMLADVSMPCLSLLLLLSTENCCAFLDSLA